MDSPTINPDARALEEEFFARENRRLLERLREKKDQEARRAAMRKVIPKATDEFVDHLLELGIQPEIALAITVVPLVAVAWADGDVAPRERETILKEAEQRGVTAGTAAHDVLESWLKHKPAPALIEAWKRYIHTLRADLSREELNQMRERGMDLARGVAEAAGGFLGMSKVSATERKTLEELERVFE